MKKNILIIILYIAGGLALAAIVAYVINFHKNGISGDTANWGTLGDFMGGVIGTIFGFASVILIYLTFQKQQETSVLQQFETTFFNLLNIQREMMKSVKGSFEINDRIHEGQDFFERLAAKLNHDYIFFLIGGLVKKSEMLFANIMKRPLPSVDLHWGLIIATFIILSNIPIAAISIIKSKNIWTSFRPR